MTILEVIQDDPFSFAIVVILAFVLGITIYRMMP